MEIYQLKRRPVSLRPDRKILLTAFCISILFINSINAIPVTESTSTENDNLIQSSSDKNLENISNQQVDNENSRKVLGSR